MSKKTDVDALAELPVAEIDERIAHCERVETRAQRAMSEPRDLTERENDLCADDKLELGALRDALQLRRRNAEHRERIGQAIGHATETRSRPTEARAQLDHFTEMLAAGQPASRSSAGR
ncbi:MAG: hypothetical protein JWR32_745 [Mycobacterium sp.]|jgi:hypothetical protein|nr:hypothetical protein [Mycobacterium sp.]